MSSARRGLLLSGTVLLTALLSPHQPDSPPLVAGARAVPVAPAAGRDHLKAVGLAPMVFEPNRGQADPQMAFVARGRGYAVEIADRRARLRLIADPGHAPAALEMEVVGASPHARAAGTDPQPGKSHYFVGSDPARHVRDVPHLASVDVHGIYPDIDLVYYGNQSDLEYDFSVRPGAHPEQIALRFRGQDSLELSPAGDLIFRFGARELRHPRPVLYELPERTPVEGRFVIADDGTVGFDVGNWDRTRTLVIDPTLVFGTYLGGTGNDTARGVAVDTAGNIYVGGTTASTSGFPLQGALQGTFGGGTSDAFVTKFNATGTAIVYSTFVGSTGVDEGRGIAVDTAGRAYLTGSTSASIPGSTTSCLSGDAFVVKLEAAGNALAYARCLGTSGTEAGNAIAVDGSGNAYVTGLWNGGDVFVGKLNSTGTTFTNTILAGNSIEEGFGIAADVAGNVCVTGQTWSTNFPVVNARQPSLAGGQPYDAFVAKYNSAGAAVFVTYLGGSSLDTGNGAAIDGSGNCYVTGSTLSTNFPTQNAGQVASGGGQDAFVTAYDSTGSNYLYSTYLGGSRGDLGLALAVTTSGIAHVVGQSDSQDFPVQGPAQPELKDLGLVLASSNAAASFSRTGLAGASITALAVDPTNAQVVYAGTTNGVYKTTNGGASWTRIDSGLTYTNISSLAIDPNAPCTIYAGISTSLPSNQNTTGVLIVSTNCGASWGVPAGGLSGYEVRSLTLTSANPSVLYIGLVVNDGTFSPDHHVARSITGGFAYSQPGLGNYEVAVDPQNPCTAYAGEAGGRVYQNTSCTTFSWTQVGAQLSGLVNTVAVRPANSGTLVAGTTAGIIYRKVDANPWSAVATVGGSVNAIAFQPGSAQVAYAGSTDGTVYKSVDGGGTWSAASTIGPGVTALGVTAAASNSLYAATSFNSDAFYARLSAAGSSLGATWIGGYGPDEGRGVAIAPDGDAVVAGTANGRGFPTPGGVFTSPAGAVDSFIIKIGPNPPPNPAPTLTGLAPTGATAGGPGFPLTVNGSSFINESQVRWNGAARPTTFISSTQLQAAIAAGDIASAGSASVTVFTPTPGGGTSTAAVFTIQSNPTMSLDRTSLSFGAVTTGTAFVSQTAAQVVRLAQSGSGTVTWTATPNQPWLQVSPASGTGSANLSISVVAVAGLPAGGAVAATITLSFAGASNAAGPIAVTLTLVPNGTSTSPVGVVDTPANNTTGVTGAIPFTGWALDDVEVTRVMICRAAVGGEVAPVDPNCGGATQIFVGFGLFIDGARPDVQAAYPTMPANTRAGWGFMVLTNMLPDIPQGLPAGGNGQFQFFMYAQDRDGHTTLLGTRTMTCANASATKPFGAIDTPTQGGVASGTSFVNFGWALTPQPKLIPLNGSTMSVLVDGAALGPVDYNHERADIEALFPGFQNTAGANGAIGFRVIDTTTLTNGLHTISWTVIDNQGAIEGIGSRFFTVANGAGAPVTAAVEGAASSRVRATADVIAAAPADDAPVLGRRGWDLAGPWQWYGVGGGGRAVIRGEEIDRFELALGEYAGEHYTGHVRVGVELVALPVGSRLDGATGSFTWAPGVGFVGTYDLVFVRWAGTRAVARHEVRVILAPKGRGHAGVQVEIDTPRSQQDVGQPFLLAGWAADLDAATGTGIDTVHVWAYPATGGAPVFLGTPTLGGVRPDVAAEHGDQFREAGFALTLQGLIPGAYDLALFPRSHVTGAFAPPTTVNVAVRR